MNNTIFVGVVIGLFAIMAAPSVMAVANASIENNSSEELPPDRSRPIQPYRPIIEGQAVEHINQAQAALQNGDTEGANNHLELAKQSLQGNQSGSGQ